jgi:hypothetical protein
MVVYLEKEVLKVTKDRKAIQVLKVFKVMLVWFQVQRDLKAIQGIQEYRVQLDIQV